jgi:hypothetical protein
MVRGVIRRETLLFDHLQASKTLGDAGRSLLLGEFVRNMKRVLVDARTLKADRVFAKLSIRTSDLPPTRMATSDSFVVPQTFGAKDMLERILCVVFDFMSCKISLKMKSCIRD